MAYVVDKGILKLIAQVNAAAPNRSKASDGTLGDPAHQERISDHNPEHPAPLGNPDYQVDACDLTHDPAHNADMGIVSEAIRVSRDRRVSYIIFNKRITGPGHGWAWDDYTGTDPHTGHLHVSVNDVHRDEIQDWSIGIMNETDFQTLIWRMDAVVHFRDTVIGGPTKGEKVELTAMIKLLQAQVKSANDKLDSGSAISGAFTISGSGTVQ